MVFIGPMGQTHGRKDGGGGPGPLGQGPLGPGPSFQGPLGPRAWARGPAAIFVPMAWPMGPYGPIGPYIISNCAKN